MIRINQDHLAKVHNMTTFTAVAYLNSEIQNQLHELKQKGVLRIECERHFPADKGKDNTYQTKCGGCGETIYPSGWEKVT